MEDKVICEINVSDVSILSNLMDKLKDSGRLGAADLELKLTEENLKTLLEEGLIGNITEPLVTDIPSQHDNSKEEESPIRENRKRGKHSLKKHQKINEKSSRKRKHGTPDDARGNQPVVTHESPQQDARGSQPIALSQKSPQKDSRADQPVVVIHKSPKLDKLLKDRTKQKARKNKKQHYNTIAEPDEESDSPQDTNHKMSTNVDWVTFPKSSETHLQAIRSSTTLSSDLDEFFPTVTETDSELSDCSLPRDSEKSATTVVGPEVSAVENNVSEAVLQNGTSGKSTELPLFLELTKRFGLDAESFLSRVDWKKFNEVAKRAGPKVHFCIQQEHVSGKDTFNLLIMRDI